MLSGRSPAHTLRSASASPRASSSGQSWPCGLRSRSPASRPRTPTRSSRPRASGQPRASRRPRTSSARRFSRSSARSRSTTSAATS
eukprot:11887535-Alexandrium_andersonii.AAC.1